jgi:hypothetical protein
MLREKQILRPPGFATPLTTCVVHGAPDARVLRMTIHQLGVESGPEGPLLLPALSEA